MADSKISDLSAAAALDGTEIVPIVQSGSTVRTTVADFNAAGATDLSIGTTTTTTVDIDSSTGTNATLTEATAFSAGLLGSVKFTEIGVNTLKNYPISQADQTVTTAERVITLNGSLSTDKVIFKNAAGTALLNIQGDGVIYSNGSGGVSSNTAFGLQCLDASPTGTDNTAYGYRSLSSVTTGADNTGLGSQSLFSTVGGGQNTAAGDLALYANISGSNNVAMGRQAGRFYTGVNANTTGSESIFIGNNTYAKANGESNQIVIGHGVTGNGSDTTTIGNASTVLSVLRGTLNCPDLPTSSAGLNAGDVWNNSGVLNIV